MINLLPPKTKKDVGFARRNTILLRACVVVIGVMVGVSILIGGGLFYLSNTTSRLQDDNQKLSASLKDQNIDEVKTQIQDFSGSLNLVIKVLSKEVLFSQLLKQAGSVMPSGSSLSSLEISSDQKGIDITADVLDYQVGTQVQINLSDPNNKLFQKVDLVSVECNNASTSKYPCTAKLRALLADNSPYLFINKGGN